MFKHLESFSANRLISPTRLFLTVVTTARIHTTCVCLAIGLGMGLIALSSFSRPAPLTAVTAGPPSDSLQWVSRKNAPNEQLPSISWLEQRRARI